MRSSSAAKARSRRSISRWLISAAGLERGDSVVARVHAERDGLQPRSGRFPLPGVVGVTVVKHVVDDAPVKLVAVLGQAPAAVIKNAQRGQEHRVLDQRREIVAAADGLDQPVDQVLFAQRVKPAGDEQVSATARAAVRAGRSANPDDAIRLRPGHKGGWSPERGCRACATRARRRPTPSRAVHAGRLSYPLGCSEAAPHPDRPAPGRRCPCRGGL